EDGVRYFHVTGVQTCALPIYDLLVDGVVAQVGEERRLVDVHEPAHGAPVGGRAEGVPRLVGGARGGGHDVVGHETPVVGTARGEIGRASCRGREGLAGTCGAP